MRKALTILQQAIENEKKDPNNSWIDFFAFAYKNIRFEFLGHYYAYVYEGNDPGEAEYCWKDYDDMLDTVILETKLTVREMLQEITEDDFTFST